MSQENVDIMRDLFEAYGRGEYTLERLDPDVVWRPAEELPMQGVEAVRGYLERWESEWEDLTTVAEEFIDAGENVFVAVRFSGRGRHSGIEVDARTYEVYTLRGGRVIRMEEFTDRTEALEAAGLSE